jgi:hypothetical protein
MTSALMLAAHWFKRSPKGVLHVLIMERFVSATA